MSAKKLTIEQLNSIVDSSTDILVEGLKAVPGEAGVTTEQILERIKQRLDSSTLTGEPQPLKIIHAAVNVGQVIASQTETPKDDLLLGKIDTVLDKFEENGENILGAIFTALFKRINPGANQ